MTSSKSNDFTKAPPPNTNTLEIKVQLMDLGSEVLEKTFKSPKDSKEIKSVNPQGNQLWIFIGSTDAEAEATQVSLNKWVNQGNTAYTLNIT